MKPTVLVVDDTPDIRELLEVVLDAAGFAVVTADGAAAMDSVLAQMRVDLIVLDTMMPGEDGFSVCRRISAGNGPPIIMLSAKNEDIDKIKGLDLGAEDYVSKPFSNDELIARIKAVFRRLRRNAGGAEDWRFFGWVLEKQARRLTSPTGRTLALTPAEFALLKVFLDHPDRPLRREQILKAMDEVHGFSTPRGLDTLVSRLRQKLAYADPDSAGDRELIQTVYGVGYMLRPGLGG
ncbi:MULTISPECIES: response regulator [Asticcacaulis]|uniref:response regulator n=1 Tax=Asticcacaulis TaxID=76890 RepID=UPI001FDA0306|nr:MULTISPECIES: response regulator transcription factor [Asticcacaulis]MBP2160382.1 DNA-binding response OmpR family regulator [Asticcacaulis solisilvae]MDR6801315.1 DNA-binding response OmpR family regulator [Asticcacaulis sp. BE141]